MDRVDVIEMAKKAGFTPSKDEWLFIDMLTRFAALIKEAVIAELVKDGWEKEKVS